MTERKSVASNVPGKTELPDSAKVRLTLDLSQKLNAEVEELAQLNGTTKADVLRFAIEFLAAATAARRAGMHVGAWSEDTGGKRREREFIGL
jgi:hypothetical protein